MKNKRKTSRVECIVPVEGKEGGIFDTTKTIDISKAGIGLVSHRKIPLNKEIPIELDLQEDKDPVMVVGKVRWVRPIARSGVFRVGLSFKDVEHGGKSRLDRYLNK